MSIGDERFQIERVGPSKLKPLIYEPYKLKPLICDLTKVLRFRTSLQDERFGVRALFYERFHAEGVHVFTDAGELSRTRSLHVVHA